MKQRDRRRHGARRLAQGLGLFSIGLGLAEMLAPREVALRLGMPGRGRLVSTYGLREVVTGAGIMLSRDPTPWICARLGGDALDLGSLATNLDHGNPRRGSAALAFAAVLGLAALDVACANGLAKQRRIARDRHIRAARSGMPFAPDMMRGAAQDDATPREYRRPEALRPFKPT